jgi:hypothetical protein
LAEVECTLPEFPAKFSIGAAVKNILATDQLHGTAFGGVTRV